jgi:ubiquitin-protein ligase
LNIILFNRLQKDPPAGIAAVPSDDNILIWHAFILGLAENIYLKNKMN